MSGTRAFSGQPPPPVLVPGLAKPRLVPPYGPDWPIEDHPGPAPNWKPMQRDYRRASPARSLLTILVGCLPHPV